MVHQRGGDKTRIIMNDLSEYQCNLQPVYPPSYKRWSENDSKDVLPFENKGTQSIVHTEWLYFVDWLANLS